MKELSASRLSTLASWIYVFAPFITFLVSPFCLIGVSRFGVQWHVLLVSCLIAASFIALTNDFWSFIKSLFARLAPKVIFASCLLWLSVLVTVHGWSPQQMSILSGIVFALMLPVCLFIACRLPNKAALLYSSVFVLSVLVVSENIFLIVHKLSNIPFASIYLNQLGPFRLFLNPRDGNFIALIQFQLVCLCCLAARHVSQFFNLNNYRIRLLVLVLFSQAFFNAWFTGGRALLVSLLLGLCVLLLSARRSLEARLLAVITFFSGLISWMVSESISLLAFKMHGGGLVPDFVERGSGGRFEIWAAWVRSWLDTSLVFGHGLGFLPSSGTNGNFTPHNLFVQLLADSGLLGVVLFVLLLYYILTSLLALEGDTRLLFQLAIVPLTAFSLFGAIFSWPAGVWAFGLLILVASCLVDISGPAFTASRSSSPVLLSNHCRTISPLLYLLLFAAAVVSLSDLKYQALSSF
ncbi:O-antigen ligase family protein [Synechococcus sp. MIT S9503]|uniref:O-antigen ligase family protein n=1 Tax=Synechococcus sp. MIT S9503 TaxID=3082547 RepID=UPI0039A436BB